MTTKETAIKARAELARRELARRNFSDYVPYVYPGYELLWFHLRIAETLSDLYYGRGKPKKMIFVPPQHGKSELASRLFPSWLLGKNPDAKIALASYSPKLSSQFNRKAQQYIDSQLYRNVFPGTQLNSKNVSTDSRNGVLRNSEIFEVVGHNGFFKTVGIGQALTGTPVDFGIIDDPFKDRKDANSETIRNNVWDWYNDVFLSRLPDWGKQLLLFTRWHEDDLAGRLLKQEPDEWDVIKLPALREDLTDTEDPRELGAELWPGRHGRKKLESIRDKTPRTFISLYQQRPSAEEGDMLKSEWLPVVPQFHRAEKGVKWRMVIDGAFTKNTRNDPTGITIYARRGEKITITYHEGAYLEEYELLKRIESIYRTHAMPSDTIIYIEPKASGHGLKSHLKNSGYNVKLIDNEFSSWSKEDRVETAQPYLVGERVELESGGWTRAFVDECTAFPNGAHDECVDNLAYACLLEFHKTKKREFFAG